MGAADQPNNASQHHLVILLYKQCKDDMIKGYIHLLFIVNIY